MYNPASIESKWQQTWEQNAVYATVEKVEAPKWYALTMLPYPSGDLHAGHWYAMVPSDAAARYKRMSGYNVFFPMGFDSFGLPAENAAIKHQVHPAVWTEKNIERMRLQLRKMGAMWSWDRELATSNPEYYKWTQWLFLRLYEHGLAYREFAPVDWCPSCQTTLAREQVWGDDRHCERCNTPVVKRALNQWKLRITNYADELLQGLESLEWPERVKNMQANWIGRSEGATVRFRAQRLDKTDGPGDVKDGEIVLEVFTTRPDTLWGATALVLAPEHPAVAALTTAEQQTVINEYRENADRMDEVTRLSTTRQKTGAFTGSYAINPASGENIPIWIADYVIASYGTGAVMSVPAHDPRDFEFSKRFNLPVKIVITPDGEITDSLTEAYTSKTEGVMVNSGPLTGTPVGTAIPLAIKWLEEHKAGEGKTTFRLRDWLISRQRMWGCPIPMIICPSCDVVPVPYEQLPVVLPEDAEFTPTGESPLRSHPDFQHIKCPKCGGDAERETDTMDTFMCSSWYQYGYISPGYKAGEKLSHQDTPWDPAAFAYWAPVDQYTGGVEHSTMHLLYTRFFTKALRDIGVVPFDEPMRRLFSQGTILGPDGEKMSKSRGNVVNPDEGVATYGADTIRGYVMFIGPWDQGGPWSPTGIEGVSRFLHRVWNLVVGSNDENTNRSNNSQNGGANQELAKLTERLRHQTIQRVTQCLETFKFNTAISALMEFNNHLTKNRALLQHSTSANEGNQGKTILAECIDSLLLLMAPFFPHICEELWLQRSNANPTGDTTNQVSIHLQSWPTFDAETAKDELCEIVVQINGKVRGNLRLPANLDNAAIEENAREDETVKRWIEGNTIKRVIVVPNRLINFVVQ